MKIEFTCTDPAVKEHFDVKPANKIIPEWYKDLPTREIYNRNQLHNIKECMPAQDMMMSGYIIFNTFEFILYPIASKGIEHYDAVTHNPNHISSHLYEQCPVKIQGQRKNYFKISNPWRIETPPGYSCFIMQPFYHFDERFQLLPGIVDTDRHDMAVDLPGYMISQDPITVESGTPIAQIIPFKRDDWTMETSVKPRQTSRLSFTLNSAYRRIFHSKKVFK